MSELSADQVAWAAWRVTDTGRVRVVATLAADRKDAGPERRRREYPTLEAAAGELGDGFREVVERVLAEGRRQGRWRP